MKAIILAAGEGTRLKKYTEELPKGMLLFDGKTLIERQIEIYRKCGIDKIIIVRGFEADKIKYEGVTYYTNYDYKNTNMVESLMTAREEFDEDIIISYSDILFEEEMLLKMMKQEDDYSVAVDDNWKFYWEKRYGKIDFDIESLVIGNDDNIIELGLEDCSLDKIDARYIGLLKFSKKALEEIVSILKEAYFEYEDKPWQQSGKVIRKAYMTDLLNAIIQLQGSVKAVHFQNGWIEFDTNEDYEKACQWLKDGSINKLIKVE